ncbi:MAG: helix-turn-helix transcriptional regulator [Acidobacteriota bacterium]|nr:helix-turn-helix transcriptional regulator [Acidobacteriota bacterium]
MLDIAILGLLMDRDHHGYEIRSQLRDRLGISANVSFGSIYPALARLERHGSVEAVTVSDPRLSSLSTGSLSGERAALRTLRSGTGLGRRGRKVYRITERGRREFVELLANPATLDDAKGFSMRMALAKYLTPNLRVGLLERRRSDLLERLAEVRTSAHNVELDEYARSVMEHAARGVELDLAWIDTLLSAERNNSNPQPFARDAK